MGGSAEGTPFGPLEDANGRSAERSARDRGEAGRHAVSKVKYENWRALGPREGNTAQCGTLLPALHLLVRNRLRGVSLSI